MESLAGKIRMLRAGGPAALASDGSAVEKVI
jgi:hypothetical protein